MEARGQNSNLDHISYHHGWFLASFGTKLPASSSIIMINLKGGGSNLEKVMRCPNPKWLSIVTIKMQGGYDSMKNVLFRCNFLGFLTLYYRTLLFVKGAESLSQIQKSSSSYSLLVTHALSSTLLFYLFFPCLLRVFRVLFQLLCFHLFTLLLSLFHRLLLPNPALIISPHHSWDTSQILQFADLCINNEHFFYSNRLTIFR